MITCVCRGRGRWRGEVVVGEMVAYGFEVDIDISVVYGSHSFQTVDGLGSISAGKVYRDQQKPLFLDKRRCFT